MAQVVTEVFLRYVDERSNKGYASRVQEEPPGSGTWQHVTQWGGVGKSFQAGVKEYPSRTAAESAHQKVIQEKVSKGYRDCDPALLGFTAGEAIQTASQAAPEVHWTPMLFDAVLLGPAGQLIRDSAYFAQRKMDGERRRLLVDPDGTVKGFNRRGIEVPVPGLLRESMLGLARRAGNTVDLDGEVIGNNSFHVWDLLTDPDAPAGHRYERLRDLMLGDGMVLGIHLVETALDPEGKAALYEQAIASGWEGLMFKRKDGRYFGGRSPRDFKFKLWNEATILVTGANQTAKREEGSFRMAWVCPDGRHVPIGNVAGGTTEAKRLELVERLQQGPVLVDVRYLYFDKAALFQPTFRRIRNDIGLPDLGHQKLVGRDGVVISL